jgi:hypothetical protein
MEPFHPLRAAIEHVGLTALARALSVTHQAVRKWEAAGRPPRTEWTGETDYAGTVEQLTADRDGGPITRAMWLATPWPQCPADASPSSQPPAAEQAGQGGAQLATEVSSAA